RPRRRTPAPSNAHGLDCHRGALEATRGPRCFFSRGRESRYEARMIRVNGTARPGAVAKTALPSWYPRRFDLEAAAKGARSILAAQGDKLGGAISRVTFTDADLTFLNTTVGEKLVDRRGMPVLDPQ